MPVRVRAGGLWKPLGSAKAFINGQWRSIRTIRVYRNGAWRAAHSFSSGISAVAEPSETFDDAAGDKPTRVYSAPILARVSGGVAPYQYAWTITQGLGAALSSPTTATTSVSKVLFNSTDTIEIRCTVTDATDAVATCDAIATLSHSDLT